MSEAIKQPSGEKVSPQLITQIGEYIIDTFKGRRLTFEIFVVLVSLLLSMPVFAQDSSKTDCDPDEIDVVGADLLPQEIDVDEIQKLYELVCERMEGGDLFEPGSVTLDIQPIEKFGEPVNDIAFAYARDGIGYVGVAAGDSRLSQNEIALNPGLWRMIVSGHEVPHLIFGEHGLGASSISGFHQTGVSELVQGLRDVYWWELVMLYASANRCDIIGDAAQAEPELATEVCEEAAEIIHES